MKHVGENVNCLLGGINMNFWPFLLAFDDIQMWIVPVLNLDRQFQSSYSKPGEPAT